MEETLSDKEKLIKDEIIKDAQKKSDRQFKKIKKEKDKIIKNAEKEAQKKYDQIVNSTKEEATKKANKIIASIDIDIKRMRLNARGDVIQKAIDTFFEKAKNNEISLKEEEIISFIEEGINAINDDKYIIDVKTEDKSKIEEKIKKKYKDKSFTFREIDQELSGGAIVYSSDEKLYVDNSLEGRFDRLQGELRVLLYEKLFE